jgi:hypothetical protein
MLLKTNKMSYGEISLEVPKLGFSPTRPENADLFTVRAFSLHHYLELAACLAAPFLTLSVGVFNFTLT